MPCITGQCTRYSENISRDNHTIWAIAQSTPQELLVLAAAAGRLPVSGVTLLAYMTASIHS